MAITRWDRGLGRVQSRINQLFEDALRGGSESEEDWNLTQWAPPVDIYEQDGNLVIKAELPGVNPEDLKVHVESNVLSIRGERKLETDVKRESFHRIERVYGTFTRSFALPPQYDQEKVQAEFKDGVLKIAIPRSEKARPRQIAVAGSGQQSIAKEAQAAPRAAKPKEQQAEEQEQEVAVRRG
jgi:HSP20 family protein